jgi:hypothetical protein
MSTQSPTPTSISSIPTTSGGYTTVTTPINSTTSTPTVTGGYTVTPTVTGGGYTVTPTVTGGGYTVTPTVTGGIITSGTPNPLMNLATGDIIATEQNIITEIQNLQAYEVSLYNELETSISSGTATTQELNDLSNQINEVSSTRDGLYETLYSLFSFYTNNLSDTSVSLQNQTVALEIVENELNSAKKRLAYLEEQKINKLRLVEIKKYYGEKYEEHTYVMTYIIGMFIWVFILSLLANRGLLPDNVYFLLLLIVIVFYGILIIRTISRIIYRDKMN